MSTENTDTNSNHPQSRWFICSPKFRFSDQRKTPQWRTGPCPNNKKKDIRFWISFFLILESARRDSNPRPQPWQGCTPPTEPLAHYLSTYLQNHTLKIYSSVTTCGFCRSLIPFGQALDLLVTVSSTRYRASTSALSTSSSSRGLTTCVWDISS